VSGLDELTREELTALVLKLHETVQVQQAEIAQISELNAMVARQSARIVELEEEVARLRGGGSSAHLCIKPSVKKEERSPRKKRKHSFARHKLEATQVAVHAYEECPECGRKLCGGHEKWRHQVIEIPKVVLVVTDHVFMERYCGVCKKRWTPDSPDVLAGVVVGKRNIGIGAMSLICHLKTICRVPIGQIRKLLDTLWGLRISAGQIVEILHDVAEMGKPVYESLLKEVRGSPVLHADETGWREDGVNGYIWSFSSPAVRYYTYRHSRGSLVPKEVLSEEFVGALVADFYGAYNFYDGIKQRCWVHLGRDLKTLVEKNPDLPETALWVDKVMELYHRANESTKREYKELERSRLKRSFERELLNLCQPYVRVKSAPQRVLAERMTGFIGELFAFVADPEIPSENNAAERAIRPAVVARKISGGTRSEKGSKTMSTLRSLFETWGLRGQNTIEACREMIAVAAVSRPQPLDTTLFPQN
jgi:transposase